VGQLKARRLGALAGLSVVVLILVGGVVHGSPPAPTASAATITSFYRAHHAAVLVSLLMAAAGFVVLLVWASVLAVELRAAGRSAAAGTLLASITAAAAVSVLSGGVEVGVAQAAVRRSIDPGFVRGAYFLATGLYPTPYLFVALAAAAVLFGGRRVLPVWFGWLSGVVAVLNVLGGVAVRTSGFFALNDGGAIVFAGLALAVWVLAAGWILWRHPPAEAIAPASTSG
jgi:hypothetical protein